jgi:hypothetical protein
MLITTNPAGWTFVWPSRSEFIEVYHDDASFSDQPVEVISAGTLKYNDSDLRKLANESPEYGRAYV